MSSNPTPDPQQLLSPDCPEIPENSELAETSSTLKDSEVSEPSDKIKSEGVVSSEDAYFSPLRDEILDSVARSKAVFKSEQIGDPALEFSQKRDIALEILENNPGQFLARFGTFIPLEKLSFFSIFKSECYEVEFYLQRLQKLHSTNASKTQIKNRRYAALKKLVNEGKYFCETEMRRRNPLLYEHLIGQYLTEEEKNDIDRVDISTITLLGLLLEHMDRDETHSLRVRQQQMEESAMEESDDDSSEDEQDHSRETVTDEERVLLRNEFVSTMYQRFLEGKDLDFDYTSVDTNTEYDSVEVEQRDAEDNYFDSETPEQAPTRSDSPNEASSQDDDELDAYMHTLPPVTQQVD